MSKPVSTPAHNSVSISGTLVDVTMRDGISKTTQKPYRGGTATIRVNQHYGANGGVDEVSDIPVDFIAMKFKKDGSLNAAYTQLGAFTDGTFRSIQDVGLERASRIRVDGRFGTLSENMYVGRDGSTVNSAVRINTSFFSREGGTTDSATFTIEIYIMGMNREINTSGEETGRLHIRGAVVQWGQRMDVLDFYVENPGVIDFYERNYNVNDTVKVVGRIRWTSMVEEKPAENSWGEYVPQTTTRTKRELILVNGDDNPYEEELTYATSDIQSLNADRTSRREQLKIDARNRASAKKAQAAAKVNAGIGDGMEWEDDM